MNKFEQLTKLVRGSAAALDIGGGQCLVCPKLGGRVFAQLAGENLHRIDLDNVARPDRPFNNYGGGNLWPAPEGGPLGFNYQNDQWYVPPAINNQPYELTHADASRVVMRKVIELVNRKGTLVRCRLSRELTPLADRPTAVTGLPLRSAMGYRTIDRFEVLNEVAAEDALIAAWTLEQFDATEQTLAFVSVERPESAINFDFYPPPPHERIAYRPRGFTYRVDGRSKGQIGVRVAANARGIGFVDPKRGLLCLRCNESDVSEGRATPATSRDREGAGSERTRAVSPPSAAPATLADARASLSAATPNNTVQYSRYFNIADNAQPGGLDSAADNYSIFNSDSDMVAFELETVGAANIEAGQLRGSELISTTFFALLDGSGGLDDFLNFYLGA